MRFRQKPPTEDGYYYALPVGDDELVIVLVRIESYGTRIDSPLDAGREDSEYDRATHYSLWGVRPITMPKFKYQKRLLYGPKPCKAKPLPPSCRRWGHKWERYTPEPDTGPWGRISEDRMVYERCARCGSTKSHDPIMQSFAMAIMMSENRLLEGVEGTPTLVRGMGEAKTATEEIL